MISVKWCYPLFFMVFSCNPIFMYTCQAQDFKGKLMGGLNGSQVDGDGIGGFNKPGLAVGGAVAYPLKDDQFEIEANIYFIQKGSKSTDQDPGFLKISLSYIEFPLLLNYWFIDGIYGQTGLVFSYLLKAKIDDGFGFTDRDDDFNLVDFGLMAGFGYEITQRFDLSIRYSHSLTRITKEPFQRAWNSNLSFFLGFRLSKSK